MSEVSIQIQDLITRFKLPIPFGTKDLWEYFGKLYCRLVVCNDLLIKTDLIQSQFLSGLFVGKSELSIWDTVINLEDDSDTIKFFKITKALIDGNMSVYGYPETTFDNLEIILNNWINEMGQDENENFINKNGWDNFKYKIKITQLDDVGYLYQYTAYIYQESLDTQFDDLIQYGIYTKTDDNTDKSDDTVQTKIDGISLPTVTVSNPVILKEEKEDPTITMLRMKELEQDMKEKGFNIDIDDSYEINSKEKKNYFEENTKNYFEDMESVD